ncbi:long-chain fatty acid--CoA ligase [Cryomorpha ignava]|uniref:Long-chain fatty acid--CoA ligase n=2 Tax=Cryomorpha ignava TaxID=101383 RepID=A0A7K3WM93_9FLAO|nr:long-chain fatty acid--CoA ligase [Cryomorpha ignava]
MELNAETTRLFDFYAFQQKHFPAEDSLAGKVNGKWVKYSTAKVLELANKLSTGLLKLGIEPGDKIALISNNRPEWIITDLAILQIGAINVPMYPTISEKDYEFIFNDSEVKIVFVSDTEILEKVRNAQNRCPDLKSVFSFDKIENTTHWSSICSENPDTEKIEKLKSHIKASDLATLIYTSGTTGNPKGVMLSHSNIASNAIASKERLPVNEDARGVSFLPLCHVYERMLSYLYVYTGVSLYFAESLETIGADIKDVKPEVFTAVPRVLEKVFDKIIAKGSELTGIKKKLFFWSVGLAEKYEPYAANGPIYEIKLKIANKLIFSKWREALGGQVKAVASGSASLNPRLARIFNAAGIPVLEGYGLTETSPVVSVNQIENNGMKFGTTGRPIKDVQVKIAEDGEILVKGPNVMMGYYKRPDLTKEVMDTDGWFHTGDIGEMVDGQFLKITDRKKEIFKTSGGKYIAPQMMENKFKESRFIEQLIVIGENRKHPSALIVPDYAFLKDWCSKKGYSCGTNKEMIENEKVIERLQKEVDEKNKSFGNWEQIKRFELLEKPFTVEGGELTPTLKLKRKQIMEEYTDLVDSIYPEN